MRRTTALALLTILLVLPRLLLAQETPWIEGLADRPAIGTSDD